MKKILTALVTAVSIGTMTTGAMAAEVIFAHGANPGNPRFIAAELWGTLYGSCTGDKVTIGASASMGNDAEMLTSVVANTIQVTANSQGAMSQTVAEIGLLGLPFLFNDLPTA